jgi:CheY-like chemotaxis protein
VQIPQIFADWDVLVVDDEQDSLEAATRLLRLAGANVFSASDGREALELIRKHHKFHFILSDLSMPEMDGWELLHVLKKDRATMGIPLIALTAHAMNGDRERALAAGFHNHISKPLDPPKFIRQLANLLVDIPDLAAMMNTPN